MCDEHTSKQILSHSSFCERSLHLRTPDHYSLNAPDLCIIYSSDSNANTISIHSTLTENGSIKHLHMSVVQSVLCSTSLLQRRSTIPDGRLRFQAPDVRRANSHHTEEEEELHSRLKAKTLFLPVINEPRSNPNTSRQDPTTDFFYVCVHALRHISRDKQKPHSRGFVEKNRFKSSSPTCCTELTASKCCRPVFPSTHRWRKHLEVKVKTES